jgi:hypothetical protein
LRHCRYPPHFREPKLKVGSTFIMAALERRRNGSGRQQTVLGGED